MKVRRLLLRDMFLTQLRAAETVVSAALVVQVDEMASAAGFEGRCPAKGNLPYRGFHPEPPATHGSAYIQW